MSRWKGLGGGLEAPRNLDQGKIWSPEHQPSLQRPCPLPGPDLGQPLGHLQHPHPLTPQLPYLDLGPGSPGASGWGVD